MIERYPTQSDWFFLSVYFIITLVSLCQAWVNLVEKKFSKYSIDGLLASLALNFGNDKTRHRVRQASKDQKRILFLGVFALLLGLAAAYEIVNWFSMNNLTR